MSIRAKNPAPQSREDCGQDYDKQEIQMEEINRKQSQKTTDRMCESSRKHPGTNIENCRCESKDGGTTQQGGPDGRITFRLKLKSMGKVVELGARTRQDLHRRNAQTGLNNSLCLVKTGGLHLMQGLTGKGAGPAVRLTSDGHFPREQEMDRDESEREL